MVINQNLGSLPGDVALANMPMDAGNLAELLARIVNELDVSNEEVGQAVRKLAA